MKYYFFATILPELRLDQKPEITFQEFMTLAKENLSRFDYKKIRIVRQYYDIENIRKYFKEEPLNAVGNLDEFDMQEAFATSSMLPLYVFRFMEKYETVKERLDHFSELLTTFFREEMRHTKGFLHWFFSFERDLRLVFLGFRAKKTSRDVIKELQYEDPEDPLVAQIIAQSDSPEYEPPEKYGDLKPIFQLYYKDPLDLHIALLEYRIQKIEDYIGITDTFSIDRILAYMVELIWIEARQNLDREKGLKIVHTILKEAS